MCLSPHEMTTEQIEYEIGRLREYIDNPRNGNEGYRRIWARRIEMLEDLLKERANKGTL